MNESPIQRYVPLAVWILVVGALAFIPLKIVSYGFIPPDDALRHAAKAVSGKAWPDILVMRPDFATDHNPGWHVALGTIHRHLHVGTDGLVTLCVAGLLGLVLLSGLPAMKRPEAWLLAVLAVTLAQPGTISRFSLGRPLILSMAIEITLLWCWSRPSPPGWPLRLLSVFLCAASTWMHGAWYLFALLVLAFALSGNWRRAAELAACWLTGAIVGASLTGHPLQFLALGPRIAMHVFEGNPLPRLLVTEFYPGSGDLAALLVIVIVLAVRLRSGARLQDALCNPVLLTVAIAWLLGLKTSRFWDDWGRPALILWIALELEEPLRRWLDPEPLKRLAVVLFLAFSTYQLNTSDQNQRFSWNLTLEFLSTEEKAMAEWLPEPGGVVYSADMGTFYRTFFKNPHAPWRYILGFEQTFMPPDDLKVLRNIYWNRGATKAYEPWVAKMRPQDRLIIAGGSDAQPKIKGLEWNYTATDTWIGRLPKTPSAAPANTPPGSG